MRSPASREPGGVKLEVIAVNAAEAAAAVRCGADRIEYIAAFEEGGLTPEPGSIQEVVEAVPVPVHVMVRPHSRSFRYERDELLEMAESVRLIRAAGAGGVVLGALTREGTVDEEALKVLLEAAGDLSVTFHRAFDEIGDQPGALRTLLAYPQIRHVLTSGGRPSALEAAERLRELTELSRGTHLTVLAGSGLRPEGLEAFLRRTGVREVHFGTGVRFGGDPAQGIDPERMQAVKAILERFGEETA
ncbi:copper homeostasis protein CutC [Paenibacillus mucilaginosus]|uniref:copper homeostasis protein CutC n=1 Tax=Paenibacillus mucilaginosus TaxID=61624 RepID=UPI001F311761|nr:copper homeostasis protein CutC [Paenibacillus mucilaginosus]MCG7212705.1 copper homeostasis protein CutC [Paenibacillus mucilaginosus]